MALKIHTQNLGSTLIDRGQKGTEEVKWAAWRDGRPNVRGYGQTEQEAVNDLKYFVQPDATGELDGERTPGGK